MVDFRLCLALTIFLMIIADLLTSGDHIPTTLEGPFQPVTHSFDSRLRRGSDDLPMDHPRLRRNVTSFFPEQISLAISSPTSMWVSWITGTSHDISFHVSMQLSNGLVWICFLGMPRLVLRVNYAVCLMLFMGLFGFKELFHSVGPFMESPFGYNALILGDDHIDFDVSVACLMFFMCMCDLIEENRWTELVSYWLLGDS